jgi:ketosteroid isomerase-like protein
MSQNLAMARRWVELYNDRGDVAEFLSLLDPEVELQTPGGPRLHGHDEARDWFEKEFENVESRIIPDRFVEEGDVVAGLGRTEVRWIESGGNRARVPERGGVLVSREQDRQVAAVRDT